MKKKLDNKFWRTQGHCFDCQVDIENKKELKEHLKIMQKPKCWKIKKSYLKDLEQSLDDFEKTGGKNEWFNKLVLTILNLKKKNGKWVKNKFEKTIIEKQEILYEKKRELVEKAENELQGAK